MKRQVLILVMIALIRGLYSTSHADIISIEPGSNDTSLIVEFNWRYFKGASGSESKNFTFHWREKGVSEEWESDSKRYTYTWASPVIWFYDNQFHTTTDTYTITGLKFGTTYEVMMDNSKGEGTTSLTGLVVSSASPLVESELDKNIVTLTLNYYTYEQDITKIGDAVSISGIPGLTLQPSGIQSLSDTEVNVQLDYDGDFDVDTLLIFTMDAEAIVGYTGDAFTVEILVPHLKELGELTERELLLSIYWTDNSRDPIKRMRFDGMNVETLVPEARALNPGDIALDVAGGKMYWTDAETDKIQRANLDGSKVKDLVTRGWRIQGIALDVEDGKMYWADDSRIRRANLDGTDIEDLVTAQDPRGIALDAVGGKMYWIDSRKEKIRRANLDGTDIEDLITGVEDPRGIALDVVGGKMYWTDSEPEKIQRANLNGTGIEDLVIGVEKPRGIALDVVGGKMYWADSQAGKIQRANLDGSNVEDLVIGLINPRGIAIGSFPNTTIVKEDVNRDGVVDLNDLVIISLRYGRTGPNAADVNGDEIVNVDDLILVAAAIDNAAAAAPAARAQVESHFTEAQLQGWLTEARASGNTSHIYQRGITVLEQLLALFPPKKTALLANYPNPFNPETWIPYQLSKSTDVTLTIYDIKGSVVRALDLGHQRAGVYQNRGRAAYWDGKNAFGEKVASGLYFYTLTAGDFSATRKMLIRK